MIRTQISLEEEEYELAKSAAGALGISLAEFFRRALREALPPTGDARWMKFAGFVASGRSCIQSIHRRHSLWPEGLIVMSTRQP